MVHPKRQEGEKHRKKHREVEVVHKRTIGNIRAISRSA